jgi:hypothetical protein
MKRGLVSVLFSLLLFSTVTSVSAQVVSDKKVTITKTVGGAITAKISQLQPNTICADTATTCSGTFSSVLLVTFTPEPAAGMKFGTWSDGTGPAAVCNGKSGGCSFVPSADCSIRASFVQLPRKKVTVEKVGEGKDAGIVTSNPAGIACGATWSFGFPEGTTVELKGTDSVSAQFKQWESLSGSATSANCPSTNVPCKFVIFADTSVQARFGAANNVFTLRINTSGSGRGRVEVNIAAWAKLDTPYPHICISGTPCSFTMSSTGSANCHLFVGGLLSKCAELDLVPTPDPGSKFGGWQNGTGPLRSCNGGLAHCKEQIGGDESITAVFLPQ